LTFAPNFSFWVEVKVEVVDIGEQAPSVSYLYCRLPALDVTESICGLNMERLVLFCSLHGDQGQGHVIISTVTSETI
jgi:hypothetical protein